MGLLFGVAGCNRCTLRVGVQPRLVPRSNVRVAHRGGLVELTFERRRQPLRVVGVEIQTFPHSGSGDIGESFIDESSRLATLRMNDDSVSRLALSRMTRHRVSVIDMRRLASGDGARPTRVHSEFHLAGRLDPLDRSELTVRETGRFVRRCQLHTVAS